MESGMITFFEGENYKIDTFKVDWKNNKLDDLRFYFNPSNQSIWWQHSQNDILGQVYVFPGSELFDSGDIYIEMTMACQN